MVGKASLLLVMGFSLIFLVFGHNYNSVSNQSVDNYVEYYDQILAHSLAQSGANLGANALFTDNGWTDGYSDLEMNGGEINVSVEIVDASQNIRKLVSIGTYNGIDDTTEVILSPSRFSKYAYYSEDEGSNIRWTAKDTIFGPFHTEDNLLADNHPVFGYKGYSTTIGGKLYYVNSASSDRPYFYGSFQDGSPDPLNLNGLQPLRDAAADDGLKITYSSTTMPDKETWVEGGWYRVNRRHWEWIPGHYEITPGVTTVDTVYITFVNDSVQIKMGIAKPATTYKTEEVAPNGVIYAEGMDIRIKGTVEGRFSVVSDGNIYIDDDITYTNDPRTNPNSTDILGILAQDEIRIADNNATNDIKIDAALYCQSGGFGAENYDSRSVDGNINLYGGITQKIRRAVGTYTTSWGGSITYTHGFNKRYRYDSRLMYMFPPYFPICGGFQIVSWKE